MKVVDIERVIILMRFIQFGWTEERKKAFDEDLRMMLETQCEDLADHDKQIRDEVIGDVLTVLKAMHMARTFEDDYVARIEAPFYRELFAKIKQIKEQNNDSCVDCVGSIGCSDDDYSS